MVQKNAVEPNTLELLKKICTLGSMKDFALGGGTSLALRLRHRLSIDLDFFTNNRIKKARSAIHKEYRNGLKLSY